MLWLAMKLQPPGVPPEQQGREPHSPSLPNTHLCVRRGSEHAAYKVSRVSHPLLVVCGGTQTTDRDGKQDHCLVLRDVILACADYEGLLGLNKPWMKTRHFTTASLLVAFYKKAVDRAVSA